MAPISKIDLDDLLSDEAVNSPAEYYGRLRRHDPVYFNEHWNGWVLTRYEDVLEAYRNPQELSSDRLAGPWGEESDESAGGTDHRELYAVLSNFFVWRDPPVHTRMRSLVNRAFTPRSVEVLRPRVQELVGEFLSNLPTGEPVDFINDFAFHVPVIVISEYLGVPAEARDDVKQWSQDLGGVIFVKGGDTERVARAEAAVKNLADLLRPIIRSRRSDPQEDLLSGMVLARNDEDNDALSEDEIVSNAILMLFAGHETTMNLLANGVVAFNQFPDQWEKLKREQSLGRTAVEEVLRYDGPIRAMARWAKSPLQIGDKTIQEWDRVLLVQWAANRDPEAFESPDQFNISRHPNRHVAFGHGIHMCIGAPLARLEAQEVFGALSRNFRRVRVETESLQYQRTIVSRSLEELTVVLEN